MIKILVSEFYNAPIFYPFMSPAIFGALEQAFADGKETADVPESDFDNMINSFVAHSKMQTHESNHESIIRPIAVF